ncbi:MAG: CHASE2 domain-containing protein [Candidatus Krumholzibacteriia bacterium]
MSIGAHLSSFWLGRSRSARWGRAVLLAVLMPFVAILVGGLRFSRIVELKTEDLRYRQRHAGSIHPELLLVEIDDRTIREYGGQFPLPRSLHAVLLRGLMQAGARVVCFDFFFNTPAAKSSDDRVLAHLIRTYAPRVVVATHFREVMTPLEGENPTKREPSLPPRTLIPRVLPDVYEGFSVDPPYEPYLQSGAGLGHVTLLEDLEADGSIRRVPLLLQYGHSVMPALALVCWLQSQGLRTADVTLDTEGGRLRKADGTPLLEIPHGALHEVDYVGDVTDFETHRISYFDALVLIKSARDPDAPERVSSELERRFRDKIVLVGLTARSSYSVDLGITPLSASTPLLYVHANLLNDLLLGRRVRRPPVAASLLIASILLLLGAGLGPRMRPARWLWLSVAILATSFLAAHLLFGAASIMVDLVPPVLTLVLGYAGAAVFAFFGQEQEKQILRRTFDRYVSADLMEGILENAGRIELGGSLRSVTVLFLDIRGFTSWTGSLQPQVLVDELNAFLTEMVDVIFDAGGSVNKFLGDAILSVFGAPIGHPDDACRAVQAAQTMRRRLDAHNRTREQAGKPPIRLGIGIASGAVVAGNVGSDRRLEFTVIGNAVNLASRLQTLSLDGQILLDRETARLVRDALPDTHLESLGLQNVRGIDEPIEVFEISATRSAGEPPA